MSDPPDPKVGSSSADKNKKPGTFDAAAQAATVYGKFFPQPKHTPRISVPAPKGQANPVQVRQWLTRVMSAYNDLDEGGLSDSTGAFGQNLVDTFLMYLGHNGTSRKVDDEKADVYFVSMVGEGSVPVQIFYEAMGEISPRQLGRAFADRIGELAEEFKLVYRWGANHGVKKAMSRVSHDCADFMSALTTEERTVIATVKAAAITAASEEALLDPTANQRLQAGQTRAVRVAPSDQDMLEYARNRLLAFRQAQDA